MHTAVDFTRSLRTQLQSLLLLLPPATQIYRLRANITFRNPYTSDLNKILLKMTSTLRALLYLYFPMVHGPWVGRLTFYYLTLFYSGLPFDLTYYNSCFVRFAEPLQYHYPKSWVLSPKIITQGIHFPTGPQHKHLDSSQITWSVR